MTSHHTGETRMPTDTTTGSAQIDTEEAIAAYLFGEAAGFEGSEQDAADAGRTILKRTLEALSTQEFHALRFAFGLEQA